MLSYAAVKWSQLEVLIPELGTEGLEDLEFKVIFMLQCCSKQVWAATRYPVSKLYQNTPKMKQRSLSGPQMGKLGTLWLGHLLPAPKSTHSPNSELHLGPHSGACTKVAQIQGFWSKRNSDSHSMNASSPAQLPVSPGSGLSHGLAPLNLSQLCSELTLCAAVMNLPLSTGVASRSPSHLKHHLECTKYCWGGAWLAEHPPLLAVEHLPLE